MLILGFYGPETFLWPRNVCMVQKRSYGPETFLWSRNVFMVQKRFLTFIFFFMFLEKIPPMKVVIDPNETDTLKVISQAWENTVQMNEQIRFSCDPSSIQEDEGLFAANRFLFLIFVVFVEKVFCPSDERKEGPPPVSADARRVPADISSPFAPVGNVPPVANVSPSPPISPAILDDDDDMDSPEQMYSQVQQTCFWTCKLFAIRSWKLLAWIHKIRTKRLAKAQDEVNAARKVWAKFFEMCIDLCFKISDTMDCGKEFENVSEDELNEVAREIKLVVQKMAMVSLVHVSVRQFTFWFCAQDTTIAKMKDEITATCGCRWPDVSLFDFGEDVQKIQINWHGHFRTRIRDDEDLQWVGLHTKAAIRICIMNRLEKCLWAKTVREHDVILGIFLSDEPLHQHIGM